MRCCSGSRTRCPSCAVVFRFDCAIEGIGVDPRNPPLLWEAWTGSDWAACELERDETGGLNRAGDVVVHVPPDARAVADRRPARRLAALPRRRRAEEGQPAYSASPQIDALQRVHDRRNGRGRERRGRARRDARRSRRASQASGSRSSVGRSSPPTANASSRSSSDSESGWREWSEVTTFADSGGGRQPLRPRRRRRRGRVRACGPTWRTARCWPTAPCPRRARRSALRSVSHRRRAQGQRRAAHAHRAQVVDRLRRVGREPAPCARRRRRRRRREREGARPDRAADGQSRGNAGGLRAAGARGGA